MVELLAVAILVSKTQPINDNEKTIMWHKKDEDTKIGKYNEFITKLVKREKYCVNKTIIAFISDLDPRMEFHPR